jgi:GrpB-like predicted nucleotidyltransferase (UPF0157 family)
MVVEAGCGARCENRRMGAQDRDADLDRVLIGGREQREIVIVDYDSSWPARYQLERKRVRRALGLSALRIEHIGSTAFPGLAAKPIVDLLVAVADPDDESGTVTALEAAGYELRVREPGHLMVRTPERDVHVHVWGHSDPEVRRHLMFRDRLRRSPADRDAYERLKRELAAREWADMNEYADAKAAVIEEILDRSLD